MFLVTAPVAGLKLARVQAFQVLTKGLANQSGTIHPRPPGSDVCGPK